MKYVLLLIIFVSGVIGGVIFSREFLETSDTAARQVRRGGYSLINPLLECEVESPQKKKELTAIEHGIENKVIQLKQKGTVKVMSVYLRDLNNGPWIGINEDEPFSPASLLKLPLMIAYYSQAEDDPRILSKKITYTGKTNLNVNENIRPSVVVEKGKEYTVDDLIKRMIVYSDNDAMALLVENLPIPIQDKVYQDLGVTIPGVKGLEDFMTVKEYASFFRILYNASYLSENYSQKALELLSEVDFDGALRAGVPSQIRVANKFGERNFQGKKQLHDCGVVYYPDHPYLLCVMSRGEDFSDMAESIKEVSSTVYSEINKLYK